MRRTGLLLGILAAAVAVTAGLAGGLYYAWMVDPKAGGRSRPEALSSRDKAIYLALIGDLYASEGDLSRAEARLAELGVAADGPTLLRFIEVYLDAGGQPEDVRNLAHLAKALGASGGLLHAFAPEPVTAPASSAPASAGDPVRPPASVTPEPGPRSTPTFELLERTVACAAPGQAGHIVVWTQDARGQPLPGIEVVVAWPAGEDRFYTGLRPERGGYADFEMAPATVYKAYLADYATEAARDLAADPSPGFCQPGVEAVNWRLTFQQSP